MRPNKYEQEILKIGAEIQPSLMSVLQVKNPSLLLQVDDALAEKYRWGDFAHPLEILANIRRHVGRKYGHNWAEWDEEVLIDFVEREFGELDEYTKQKIWALQTAVASDAPWVDYDVFENTALAFSNQIPLWGTVEPLDLHEFAFCIGCLDAIRTDEYSDDVLGYIAASLLYNGVIALPDSMPLPDVNHIIRRQLEDEVRDTARQCVAEWNNGTRSLNNEESLLDVQLYKFQVLQEWYDNGREYISTDKRGNDPEQLAKERAFQSALPER